MMPSAQMMSEEGNSCEKLNSGFNKEVLTIPAPSGNLCAIKYDPAVLPEVCIIMLSSGMQNRAGPQRLYWKFANRAAAQGVAVLRVDLAGVGDSEAQNTNTHFDTHRKNDVDAIISRAKTEWPQARIVLQGLCAGARVAFKSAAENSDVSGLLAWSTEIYTASQTMPQSPLEPEDRLSDTAVSEYIGKILRFVITFKFINPWWWKKEYPGGEGLKEDIKQSVRAISRKVFRADTMEVKNEFLSAVDSYLADNRKVMFVFGEQDERPINEFKTRFSQIPEGLSSEQAFSLVTSGTHTYSSIAAQNAVIEISLNWVKEHYLEATHNTRNNSISSNASREVQGLLMAV